MAQYYSWRIMQLALLVAALTTLTLITLFLSETSHPGTRGVDKLEGGKFKLVWLNPFQSLSLLQSPNVTLVVRSLSLLCLIRMLYTHQIVCRPS